MRIFIQIMLGLTLVSATNVCRAEAPLAPAAAAETFQLADPALGVELVVSEPKVQSPVAMAWDADGRLYVAEMIGYPITEGAGRIRRLEDLDGALESSDLHPELRNPLVCMTKLALTSFSVNAILVASTQRGDSN